ncbi:MAG TPA: response regulator [Candidatus Binatia bacterium]
MRSVKNPPRILCVDDEPRVLDALGRLLRGCYEVVTATSGAAGLEAIASAGAAGTSFAVVVSDMRMPAMNGAEFLRKVREAAPATTRMLLTGHAELDAAIAAVNDANVFRFLCKPCQPASFIAALDAAVEQYRLVTAERELLEQTLHGSIRALTQVLALASPAAFGRAGRAKQLAGALAARLGIAERWPIEIAAMLSQIGAVTLPEPTAEKLYYGHALDASEQAMVERLPAIACELLQDIPRLGPVCAMISAAAGRAVGPEASGAGILALTLEFDALQVTGLSAETALAMLRGRHGRHDAALLAALAEEVGASASANTIREVRLPELRIGMLLADDVVSESEMLLVARGQEVTTGLLERLRNFAAHVGVRQPIRVSTPAAPATVIAA